MWRKDKVLSATNDVQTQRFYSAFLPYILACLGTYVDEMIFTTKQLSFVLSITPFCQKYERLRGISGCFCRLNPVFETCFSDPCVGILDKL